MMGLTIITLLVLNIIIIIIGKLNYLTVFSNCNQRTLWFLFTKQDTLNDKIKVNSRLWNNLNYTMHCKKLLNLFFSVYIICG